MVIVINCGFSVESAWFASFGHYHFDVALCATVAGNFLSSYSMGSFRPSSRFCVFSLLDLLQLLAKRFCGLYCCVSTVSASVQ